MAQRLSLIPVGAPGSVTKSNTLLQSMTLVAENRWMSVSLSSEKNAGNRTLANMHMIHSRCPNLELLALASLASVDVNLWFSLCDFHTSGAHGATCPAPSDVSVAFRRVVCVYHESKLLWWNAQTTSTSSLRIDELGEPMHWLSEAQIWPCLPSQPVA